MLILVERVTLEESGALAGEFKPQWSRSFILLYERLHWQPKNGLISSIEDSPHKERKTCSLTLTAFFLHGNRGVRVFMARVVFPYY